MKFFDEFKVGVASRILGVTPSFLRGKLKGKTFSEAKALDHAKALGLDAHAVGYAKQIQATSPESFALRKLGLTKQQYEDWMTFNLLSRGDKIRSLIGEDGSFPEFLSLCYADYAEDKKENKGAWKYKGEHEHLRELWDIADQLQDDSVVSTPSARLQAYRRIAVLAFYAAYSMRWQKNKSNDARPTQ